MNGKVVRTSLAAAVIVGLAAAPAVLADATGPYASGNLGLVSTGDTDSSTAGTISGGAFTDAPFTSKERFEYETGFGASGALGYDFGAVRVEGEVAWRRVDIETIEVRDATGSLRAIHDVTGVIEPELPTRTAVLSGMVNGWLDLDLALPVQPFIGGGAGVARVSSDNSSDTVFAWQVGAGIGYPLGPTVTLQAGYRYFRTAEGQFKGDTTQDGLRFRTSGKTDIDAHLFDIGVRVRF